MRDSNACTVQICASALLVAQFHRLTDDEGGDLVAAGAVLVFHFTDESGVDGIVHLLHHQLVVLHRHCVGQRTGCSGQKREEHFQIFPKMRNDGAEGNDEGKKTPKKQNWLAWLAQSRG